MLTLEELLKALNEAKAKAEAAPEDEELKAAYETAKAAYEAKKAESEGDEDDSLDEDSLDEKTKKYLAKLRKENASHRTKNKDLASKFTASESQKKEILKVLGLAEDEKPEEKVKALSNENQNLLFDKAIYETALEHGIPAKGLKYFKFLVSEAAGELGEGEELSEEAISAIVSDVKKNHGGNGAANSSVDGKKPAPAGGKDNKEISVEQFCAMGTVAKSKLYVENNALYSRLTAEAKAKKKLV